MYKNSIAYFLWFISGFGALGLHRFYLGRFGTGFLWFMTGGLGMIGAVFDFFYIPTMVSEANIGPQYRRALFEGLEVQHPRVAGKESPERVILRTAKKNKGIATPGEVALEGNLSIEEARKYLEKLVSQGYAEMKIRKSGTIAYVFPEFTEDDSEFEDI